MSRVDGEADRVGGVTGGGGRHVGLEVPRRSAFLLESSAMASNSGRAGGLSLGGCASHLRQKSDEKPYPRRSTIRLRCRGGAQYAVGPFTCMIYFLGHPRREFRRESGNYRGGFRIALGFDVAAEQPARGGRAIALGDLGEYCPEKSNFEYQHLNNCNNI